MPITMNDSRRLPAASPWRPEDPAVKSEDKVLVQPLSTYHEGSEPKNEHSEPYLATRSHAMELEALQIARIVEPPKPEEPEEPGDEAEDEADEEESEQPDDQSDSEARAEPPRRRRGRPAAKRA